MSDRGAHVEHPGCGSNAAPYVLGALTEQESRDFVRHLESCVVCREEVADLQMVADVLPAVAPQLKSPRQLRAKVLASARAEPDAEPAALADLPARTRRARAPRRTPARRVAWPLAGRQLGALAGAAAVALAVALAVVALTSSGASSTRVIRAEVHAPGARASLDVSDGHAVLQVSGMPQPAPRRVYEVWVKRAGAPQPTDALFSVTRSGSASVGVPGTLTGVKTVMVTSEPLGGSRVPTSTPTIVANLG